MLALGRVNESPALPSKCMDVTNPNANNTTGWSYLTFRKTNFHLLLNKLEQLLRSVLQSRV